MHKLGHGYYNVSDDQNLKNMGWSVQEKKWGWGAHV